MNKIKLGIVDDHHLVRAGVRALLEQIEDFEVVLEATNGKELIEKLPYKQVDTILLDIDMPEMDGIKTTQYLREKGIETKIIILTLHDEDRFIIHLMEMGANGYLMKDADPEEVEKAIRHLQTNDIYFNDFVSKVLLRKATLKPQMKTSIFNFKTDLSEREMEVLYYICEGMTNQEIAEKLHLSARTVEGHRVKIMEKLNVKNTAALVAYAIKNHIV